MAARERNRRSVLLHQAQARHLYASKTSQIAYVDGEQISHSDFVVLSHAASLARVEANQVLTRVAAHQVAVRERNRSAALLRQAQACHLRSCVNPSRDRQRLVPNRLLLKNLGGLRPQMMAMQGYLDEKKQRPPRTLQ